MSKKLKILAALIGSAFMVTSCGDNNNSETPIDNQPVDNTPVDNKPEDNKPEDNKPADNKPEEKPVEEYTIDKVPLDDDVVPIDKIIVEDDDFYVDPIVEKTCKEVNRGQSGGSLTDFFIGSCIEPNYIYTCSFSHDKTFSGKYVVRSDDRSIAQVAHDENSNSFTVKGIAPGDAIISGYTDENELVLQFVVHVRNRIPMEKIASTLFENDVYYGMYYGYKISFLSDDPLQGTLTGSDDFETTFANFKLLNGVEEKIGNGTDFNTYKFKISVDYENSSTTRTYTDLYVSTTGDKIYMYYTNGIVDIFTPEFVNIYSI
ncbi:MAG: hypothetical protein J6T15_02030 [Bacilli bacterium]|nr:hypothetical protein [Bacilli bacterium]